MKNTFLSTTICAALCLLFLLACQGQNLSKDATKKGEATQRNNKTEKISALVERYVEYGEFNGAILVSTQGEIVYQKGHGFANMEWDIPNQTNTKFRIGSITKQFTGMLIMQLVAENRLDLHAPISRYLPNYPRQNSDRITIHQLLTHSSGTPNSYESTKEKTVRPDSYQAEKLVEEFSGLELEFTPGERFEYSNAGYTVLGFIIESVTQKRYEEVLEEKILKPLKMKNTGFEKHRQLSKHRAAGYFKSWGEYYNANYIDMSTVYAAGALYSTVEDLFLWDQALYNSQLLPAKYMDLVMKAHIEDPGYGGHYGYGWSILDRPLGNSTETVQIIGHDGVINGFCAIFTRIPSSQSSIILLSNIRRAPLNAMTKGILGILYDKDYSFPKRSLAFALLERIDEEGMAKGVAYFKQKKSDTTTYINEDEMNVVSYKLLQSDRASEAAKVLELAIEVYPNAFNLYDSYGEVLRALGKTTASIENYKKSVQLNPKNENGWKKLKELGVDISSLKN